MSKKILPDIDYLKKLLDYDCKSGVFYWAKTLSNRARKGSIAGSTCKSGYVRIAIAGEMYSAHRIAWAIHHGDTDLEIDHVDGAKGNNKLSNLRLATRSQNMANVGITRSNASGFKGVSFHKRAKKWVASGRVDGVRKYIGLFETPQDAHVAYIASVANQYGNFFQSGGVQ
jgi:hypothetical protein